MKHLDGLWRRVCFGQLAEQELEIESRSLQNEIYDRRKGCAVMALLEPVLQHFT